MFIMDDYVPFVKSQSEKTEMVFHGVSYYPQLKMSDKREAKKGSGD